MPEPLRVFIGSSNEALVIAQDLQDLLFQEADHIIEPKGWWSHEVFRVGDTIIESLERIMEETDAAILVVTPDDQTTIRGDMKTQPRDNLTFECGMAIATHGRRRTALAVVGKPKLPTDLDGVKHLPLERGRNSADFKERNRARVRELIQQWRSTDIGGAAPEAANVPETKSTEAAKVRQRDDIPNADKQDALVLVKEIRAYSDDLLGKTNLVRRYKINLIAVTELCQEMNMRRQRPSGQAADSLTNCHLVTVDAYKSFERKTHWRCLGYGRQTVFESENGTKAISGVSTTEWEQMKREIPAQTEGSSGSEAVRGVSWYDAVAYCRFAGGRLPTKEELASIPSERRCQDVWEWTQSWSNEETAHIAVLRNDSGESDLIGVNPDLRLRQLGFRIIL